MGGLKKIGTIVLSVILWLIILMAALFAFTTLATRDTDHVASLAGFTPLTVASESMSPTFGQGDMIVIQQVDPATLKEGDIITFHAIIDNQYALNTHRIASISVDSGVRKYVTKGDNNTMTDTHVISDGDIVGKEVLIIPNMGKVMDFLSSTPGFLIVIVLPLLIFFVYQVYHLISVSINLKRATQEEARMAEANRIVGADTATAARHEVLRDPSQANYQGTQQMRPQAEAKPRVGGRHAADAAAQYNDIDQAARMRAEAEEALVEARRLKAEAEALIRSNNQGGE